MEHAVLRKMHNKGGLRVLRVLILSATALTLAACATRPDGGSTFLDNLFGAMGSAGPVSGYATLPPQGNSSAYTCFTQSAPYGSGGTTTCLSQPSFSGPASALPQAVSCFSQQAPSGGGATTTCLPH
jgi:hypothetical protein